MNVYERTGVLVYTYCMCVHVIRCVKTMGRGGGGVATDYGMVLRTVSV